MCTWGYGNKEVNKYVGRDGANSHPYVQEKMRSYPAWFDSLEPEQLHAHLRYLANDLGDNSRIEIELCNRNIQIPVTKQEYRRKAPTIALLLRVSYVGREPLEAIYKKLNNDTYNLRIRRSAKKKLLSQLSVLFKTDDPMYPIKAVSILESICTELGEAWPTTLAVGYAIHEVNKTLPGIFSCNNPFWKAGHTIGRVVGTVASKFR